MAGTRTGFVRIAALAVAATAWAGLVFQLDASMALAGAPAKALWAMARYFTVLANLTVALVFTGVAVRPGWCPPRLIGGVTIAIVLVGVVYATLLAGLLELSGGARLADLLLHRVTPVLVPLFWLFATRHGRLTHRDPVIWAVPPLAYWAYALLRGRHEGVYAYPFLNVAKQGWPTTIVIALIIAAAFFAAGHAMVWLDQRLKRRR
ncbi:Pr6Pr family membrane protein [Hephaestia mangrovi]|uniref:Pr6Pr family membrane protein n=1 Tax=Hephaestia mangrovi TaxID=2873268 RepID=UPI001CA69862|nr:Pr6Pr family membrane protein [Hephaestia mangrovi]MBY8829078.1 Pr6Pr family membrane protein [Hephaestia mangrovi]